VALALGLAVTLLSVISPVFNSARYLPAALASVAAIQTPHEHIVIDGGSTDESVEFLGRSAAQWVSEPDRGQTHAVNKGLAHASGDLLAWLNGDDEYIPDAVDRAVAHLEQNPEVMAVYGGMAVIDQGGDVRRTYIPAPWSWRRYLLLGDYIPTPTFIFRRGLVEARGQLDERWQDAADYDFYLRLLHGVRVERMAEAIVRFRFHHDSKTASNVWLQQDEALAIRLQWSRGRVDRATMIGFDRAKRAILPRISPWPATIADDDGQTGAKLVATLDRVRAARNHAHRN
jgi:glycosyltransferase involved in cell wall biosynthesis